MMVNHSVSVWRSPAGSVKTLLVAKENDVTGNPWAVYLISGSRPKLPMTMILLKFTMAGFTPSVKRSTLG
tara:strand:+ start:84 stop:293 length:210 start_codon:yes stop_codon:yes gene_type:complete